MTILQTLLAPAASRALWLPLTAVVLSAGCGSPKSDRPATAQARGLVTYKGEPVSDAVVVFQPSVKGGYAASATTNREGMFDLQAFPPASGAVPGSYGVTVLKISQDEVSYEGGKRGSIPQPKFLVPAKYADPKKSGIQAEVPTDGTDELLFELKD